MADPNVVYVEIGETTYDADLGPLRAGAVKAMAPDRAGRYIAAGIAKESSESAFKKYQGEREKKVHDRFDRQAEFDSLNAAQSADWDTSTTRDVTMASEDGIRRAHAQGRLVNTAMLRDKDGNVLPQDASLEQILEARQNLAFEENETTAHERSSVLGGGSHTYPINQGSTLEGKAPLGRGRPRKTALTPDQRANAPEPSDDQEGAKGASAK